MKLKHLAAVFATTAAAIGGTASAAVIPTLFNVDNPAGGTFTNFDWAANGTAFTTGFAPVVGTNFTLTYFAANGGFQGGSVVSTNMKTDASSPQPGKTYEYTIVAFLNETVTGCTPDGLTCTFRTNSGSANVYYDSNPATFANNTLGTGFGNGLLQITANILPSTSDTTFNTTVGFNVTGLQSQITYTDTNPLDPSYITPALASSTTVTTLQIGGFVTSPPATGFNGAAFNANNVVFQADGNSSFVVPEPGSLALFGLGAVGLGLAYRRRKSA